MAKKKQKLELTWIGKNEEVKLEPCILIEDPEKSYGDPNSENMLIHGDNLLALKALEQDYAGKIKCIYIDPPYNTGNAFEHCDDGIEHSLWLNLMKPNCYAHFEQMAWDHKSDSRAIFLYTISMLNLKNTISKIQNSKSTLFTLCGFPYAGKSYVSSQLQQQTDIQIVAIDDIFKAKEFDWDANIFPNESEWKDIFEESYTQVKQALLDGKNVLYDSTNQTLASRDKLRKVAESVGADTYVLYIKTPVETVWERWEENHNNPQRSVVSRELVQQTIDMFEEPTEDEGVIMIFN